MTYIHEIVTASHSLLLSREDSWREQDSNGRVSMHCKGDTYKTRYHSYNIDMVDPEKVTVHKDDIYHFVSHYNSFQ